MSILISSEIIWSCADIIVVGNMNNFAHIVSAIVNCDYALSVDILLSLLLYKAGVEYLLNSFIFLLLVDYVQLLDEWLWDSRLLVCLAGWRRRLI